MMLLTIFYNVDEFCKFFESESKKYSLTTSGYREFKSKMTLSEVMTICIYWHLSGYKDFKSYYINHVLVHLKNEFPNALSYSRFIELKSYAVKPLLIFAKCLTSESNGKSFIDSTKLQVCNNRRIYSHKTFKNMATRGQSSMGWFYGFKLHIVTDDKGDIIDFTLSTGSVHDGNKIIIDKIVTKVRDILVGDKGYIGLFEHLYKQGIKLLHRLRSNMKNKLLSLDEKELLQKRGSVIETAIGLLKNSLSLEHSRHRSYSNFLCHVFSSIAAYPFFKHRNSDPILFMPLTAI